jgi:hypothetical protein
MAASCWIRSSTGSAGVGEGVGVYVLVATAREVGLVDGEAVVVIFGIECVGVAAGQPVNKLQASSRIGIKKR